MKNEKIPLRFTLHFISLSQFHLFPVHESHPSLLTILSSQDHLFTAHLLLTTPYSLFTKKVFLVLQTYQHQDAYRQVRLPLYPVEYA